MKYLYDSPSAKPTYRVTEGEKRLDLIPVLGVTYTTNVLKDPGDNSMRWMGITPQAPWTQNCSKKAAAITA
jgi:hypothetical protein